MKLQDYLQMNSKFKRMDSLVDTWSIDYAIEKLKPLVDAGFEYDDISEFILTRWDNFVHGGKLNELLERDALAKTQKGEK